MISGWLLRLYGLSNTYRVDHSVFSQRVSSFLLRQYREDSDTFIEAAVMTGRACSDLWQIILPLAKPALATLAIYQFRAVWND